MKERVRTECLWVVSDDSQLCGRVESTLEGGTCLRPISRAAAVEAGFWRGTLTLPGAVLLDLDDDLDWGARVLRYIKGARVRTPVIVLSRDFSEEFGNKIVPEGASYFLPWNFDPDELREVVRVLLKPLHHPPG